MTRHSITLLGIVLLVCFGIFFGIEMATRGITRIQGPVSGPWPYGDGYGNQTAYNGGMAVQPVQSGSAAVDGQRTGGASAAGSASESANEPAAVKPVPQPIAEETGINRLGNKIGDLLQSAAKGTIRTVVNVLDHVVE
jgi:hypothetical protein